MVFRCALFLCLIIFNRLCLAKDNVTIGIFFNEDQEDINYWDLIKENIDETVDLILDAKNTPAIQRVSNIDILEATKQLCSFVESTKERIVAVIGPRSPSVSSVLESACSHLNIPYILITWRPKTDQSNSNVLNLYPDADLLARGMGTIIDSFDWPGFIVFYEDDEGLLRLQEVLKLKEHDEESNKNNIDIYKLEIGGDNRNILKGIKSSPLNKIILDCHVDRIMDIFRQAQEVGLLSDVSRSFFLTSLDAHTLDFAPLKTKINITTIRLFDPANMGFQKVVFDYFPDVPSAQIRVETALIYDAVMLITEAINHLKAEKVEFAARKLQCESDIKYEDDIDIIHALQMVKLSDSLTGPISLQYGKRDKFILEVIETDTPKKPIGIWNSENPEEIHLTRNATQRQLELQKRLESHYFIVTARLVPPYLFPNNKSDAYKNKRYYGYSMDLIELVAQEMNITFEFKITKDNSLPNLMKDLVERRADLGICDFTITPDRREVIDFSMPFMNLGIGILHQSNPQGEDDNMYAFMRPISLTVWFYMWTLSLVTSITMFFVARLAPKEWQNPKPWDPESRELENIWTVKNFLWLSLGSITAQGCDILPKSVPTRIISASWWFFSLIIMSSYTANLAAFLTDQRKDVTIDTVEELAAQSKVKYGLMTTGSTETFFSTSNNPLYQKMWSTMKNEKPSVFEIDNPAGVERVKSTKNGLYAFLMESTGIQYAMRENCDFRRIGGLLDSKSYGIGMPLNADYRHKLNDVVLNLQQKGSLMELKNKWWKEEREGKQCLKSNEEATDALALSNVGGIFIVLAVGIGLAYFIAIVEFLWNVRQLSVEEHLPYLETLKCELKFACKIFTKKKRAKPLPSESSSGQGGFDPEKISIARSIFSKSASLLNLNTDNGQRSPSRTSRATSNHLKVN